MSETTFIGKVAQAVEDQFDDNFVELLDPEGPLSSYGLSRAIARAVLKAIRDPSDGMIKAGQAHIYVTKDEVAEAWQAMIDDALNEQ